MYEERPEFIHNFPVRHALGHTPVFNLKTAKYALMKTLKFVVSCTFKSVDNMILHPSV